jgi:hypothetical protein
MGSGGSFLGVKRPDHEADHSPPLSAEVKNAWSYISSPTYVFMAWFLINHGNASRKVEYEKQKIKGENEKIYIRQR